MDDTSSSSTAPLEDASHFHSSDEWKKHPAAFHSIILASKRRLQIEFYFDKERITLEKFVPVRNLNDLRFFFSRATSHEDYDHLVPTLFTMEMGDTKMHMAVDDKEQPHFRIGSILAYLVDECGVLFQGIRKFSQAPDYTVTLQVCDSVHELLKVTKSDKGLTVNCGSRGVIATSPEPRKVFVLSEIASLFSPYFYNIFHGGYKESENEFVEIQDFDPEVLGEIISRNRKEAYYRHAVKYQPFLAMKVDWDKNMDVLDHCDRFIFPHAYTITLKMIKLTILNMQEEACDENFLTTLLELSVLARSNELLEAFVSKFCLQDCLEQWQSKHENLLTQEFGQVVEKRMLPLMIATEKRPKLLLRFTRGDVVCALLNDVHPILIADIVHFVAGGEEPIGEGTERDLPQIHLPRYLRRDEISCAAIFGEQHNQQKEPEDQQDEGHELEQKPQTPQHHYLLYFDRDSEGREAPTLLIATVLVPGSMLAGIVDAGAEVLRNPNRGRLRNHAILVRRTRSYSA